MFWLVKFPPLVEFQMSWFGSLEKNHPHLVELPVHPLPSVD